MSANHPPSDTMDDDLAQRYDRLFRFGLNSDLTLTSGSETYALHTTILTARSTYFASHIPSPPPLPTTTAATTNSPAQQVSQSQNPTHHHHHHHLQLPPEPPWALSKMLRYLYILTYLPHPSPPHFHFAADLNTDVHLTLLASKYGIPTLRTLASQRYGTSLLKYLVGCRISSWHLGLPFHPSCSDDYAGRGFWGELLGVLGLVFGGDEDGRGVLRRLTRKVLREVLGRWEEVRFYERSVYRCLGGFLRAAYEAVLEEVKAGWRGGGELGEMIERLREEYVGSQVRWMEGHRGPWAEEWEVG